MVMVINVKIDADVYFTPLRVPSLASLTNSAAPSPSIAQFRTFPHGKKCESSDIPFCLASERLSLFSRFKT
jgi:hypothetical protein